jgi:O-acetylserine/cysteine efflux transporter
LAFNNLLLFMLVALFFAANNIIAKVVIDDMNVPPFFYATARYAVVLVALFVLLKPMPRPRLRVVAGALLFGYGAFGLFFLALKTVDASSAAVVNLTQAPIGALLAVMLLGERLTLRGTVGAFLTFAGVLAVVYQPGGFQMSAGLWFVVGSAFCAALGAIVCKQLAGVPPLRIQAWNGLVCLLAYVPTTMLVETHQFRSATEAGLPFLAALAFMGIGVSIFAHTQYIRLLQSHDANLMAALSLMMPLLTIILGIVILGDPLTIQLVIGTLVALAGVLILSIQPRARPFASEAAQTL